MRPSVRRVYGGNLSTSQTHHTATMRVVPCGVARCARACMNDAAQGARMPRWVDLLRRELHHFMNTLETCVSSQVRGRDPPLRGTADSGRCAAAAAAAVATCPRETRDRA